MFNVLVVEDDKNLRKLITTCLKRENYQTYEATNGMEALEILDKNYIDLVVIFSLQMCLHFCRI